MNAANAGQLSELRPVTKDDRMSASASTPNKLPDERAMRLVELVAQTLPAEVPGLVVDDQGAWLRSIPEGFATQPVTTG